MFPDLHTLWTRIRICMKLTQIPKFQVLHPQPSVQKHYFIPLSHRNMELQATDICLQLFIYFASLLSNSLKFLEGHVSLCSNSSIRVYPSVLGCDSWQPTGNHSQKQQDLKQACAETPAEGLQPQPCYSMNTHTHRAPYLSLLLLWEFSGQWTRVTLTSNHYSAVLGMWEAREKCLLSKKDEEQGRKVSMVLELATPWLKDGFSHRQGK